MEHEHFSRYGVEGEGGERSAARPIPNLQMSSPHGVNWQGANLSGAWESLGISVPTISAFAYLCAHALFEPQVASSTLNTTALSNAAKAILFLARTTGALELKVAPRAFRPSERFLALYVHVGDDESLVFQDPEDLRVAIEFLAAFRELCVAGYCIHQLHGEFSLNHRGFEIARSIHVNEVEPWLSKAQNSSGM